MGDLERFVEYMGHEIRILVLPPVSVYADAFKATYQVLRNGNRLTAGTVAGAFSTAEEAADAALEAAKRTIGQ